MRIHNYNEVFATLIAAENIKEGDILTQVRKRMVRAAKPRDARLLGIAMKDYPKGSEITDVALWAEYVFPDLTPKE